MFLIECDSAAVVSPIAAIRFRLQLRFVELRVLDAKPACMPIAVNKSKPVPAEYV